MRRFFLPLTVAALILGFLVWAFRPVPVAVETALVAPRDISVTIEEEGEAQIRDVYTVSAPLAGRLRRIALHPGDRVVAGETVVAAIGPAESELLDPRSRAVASANLAAAEAAMRLGEAQVAQAEASASFARAEAARDAALFDRAAISRRGLDAANLAAQTADAALASARANWTRPGRCWTAAAWPRPKPAAPRFVRRSPARCCGC
jgi:HlyD family secretion protein